MDPQTEQTISDIQRDVASLQAQMGTHYHGGYDSTRVQWSDLGRRILYVQHTIYGADAAIAADYSTFWIAPVACILTSFKEAHAAAGTDAGAVTLDLEKLTGTTAPGSGVTMLGATVSLKGAANTVVTATLASGANLPNLSLAAGDRVALKLAGTPTAVANVSTLALFQLI